MRFIVLFVLALVCVASAGKDGWFGIGLMGQSNVKFTTETGSFYNPPGMLRPQITNPNCVFVAAAGSGTLERNITNSTVQARQINLAMSVLAAWLGRARPTMKFNIKDMAVTGTGRADYMDDSSNSDGRAAADDERVARYKTNEWGDIDLVVEFWTANDGPTLTNFGKEWAPLYLGELWNGSKIEINSTNPLSTRNPTKKVQHCFWDMRASPNDRGRCLWSRANTKWVPIIDCQFGPNDDTGVRTFLNDTRTKTFASGAPLGDWSYHWKSGHAPNDDVDGTVYAGWHYVPNIARALGIPVYPVQDYRIQTASDGSYADIFVKLPNGGQLTTFRLNERRPKPTKPLTWQQEVVGVDIQRLGTPASSRQPVFLENLTSKNISYRGTVKMLDYGSGVGADREGAIRVTPMVPFRNGDTLFLNWFRDNISPAFDFGEDDDYSNGTHRIFLDRLVETVPSITFSDQLYKYPGLPTRSFMPPLPVTGVTGAAPTARATVKPSTPAPTTKPTATTSATTSPTGTPTGNATGSPTPGANSTSTPAPAGTTGNSTAPLDEDTSAASSQRVAVMTWIAACLMFVAAY